MAMGPMTMGERLALSTDERQVSSRIDAALLLCVKRAFSIE
jgi:hypothetical protein